MPPKSKPRVLYWFRTDLRLHDSPALAAALKLEPECLWPVWCWDPHYVFRARVGANRFRFLLDCQADVSRSISKLNSQSRLLVVREAPQTLLPKLWRAWRVTHLVFEKDVDGYGRERDGEVCRLAREAGVEVVSVSGRTLWDSDELVKQNGGKPTMSMSQVQAAGKKVGDIPRPIPAPRSLPDMGDTSLDSVDQEKPPTDVDLNAIQRSGVDESYFKLAGPKGDFAVPTMEEMGLKEATSPHRGGETLALEQLDRIIADEEYAATFEKPKTAPTAFEPASTTLLSPHMHFGSLSCREFYWRAKDVSDGFKGKASTTPANLEGQLLFRDMYFGAQAALGYKFGQTVGNRTVRFVPWHLRSEIDADTGLRKLDGSYSVDSDEARDWLRRWTHGVTGFPWIDAAMRQLRAEGWIHHLARHAVACFLTRGGCYVDWERGAEVFEELLIDHETACNAGNWQWLSCTAFFAQFYRCYSPVAFPQKTDKEGEYVRRYVPELKNMPAKYIYEPWKCPIVDQKKAGCLIKGDGSGETERDGMCVYPKPMFDFAERREICIQGMKKAYDVGLYGDDKRVLDGSWRKLFDDHDEGPTQGKSFKDAPKLAIAHSIDDGEHYFMGDKDGDGAEDEGGEEGKNDASREGADENDVKQKNQKQRGQGNDENGSRRSTRSKGADGGQSKRGGDDHQKKRKGGRATLDSYVESPKKKTRSS